MLEYKYVSIVIFLYNFYDFNLNSKCLYRGIYYSFVFLKCFREFSFIVV